MRRVLLLVLLSACDKTVVSGPTSVASVAPRAVCADVTTTLTLTGEFTPLVTFAFDADPGVLLPSISLVGASGGTGSVDLLQPRFLDQQHMEAVVPAGTKPGDYVLNVTSPFGGVVTSTFKVAVVTAATAPTIGSVEPAVIDGATEIVIIGSGFLPTSEPKLVSKATSELVLLKSVAYESPTRLRAVVPGNLQAGVYGVNVSDLLAPRCPAEKNALLTVSQTQLPRVSLVSDETFAANEVVSFFACGKALSAAKAELVSGTSAVALTNVDPPTGACPPGDELVQFAGGPFAAGRYKLRLINKSDPTVFSLFDAITIVDGTVSTVTAAPSLARPRRGAAVASGRTLRGRSVVYVVGGDQPSGDTDGKSASVVGTPLASVEYASGGFDGQSYVLSSFNDSRTSLPEGRYGAAAAVVGNRFLYVFGGHTGTALATTAVRAAILDEEPMVAPQVSVASGVLPVGRYLYAVSAVLAPTDASNPNGETLPSARASVVVTTDAAISLSFAPLSNAASYRVYRTPAPPDADAGVLGKLRRIGEVTTCAETCSFTDNTVAVGAERPLELGALGTFSAFSVSNVPVLFGLASEVVQDTVYLSGGSADGTTGSAQLTRFRVRSDGGLDSGDAAQSLPAPAFQHSSLFASRVGTPTKSRLYALFGRTAAQYHHAEVTLSTGALSAFSSDVSPGLPLLAGAPGASFGRKLFLLGGLLSGTIVSAVQQGDTQASGSATFSSAALSLSSARYLAGGARVGDSVFVIGGYGCSGATCSSVERVTIR